MTPVYQTVRGIEGDCFPACVASLLDLSIHDVPNFYDGAPHGKQITEVHARLMDAWFRQRGLYYVEFGFSSALRDVLAAMAQQHPDLHYVLVGCGPGGDTHAVVCRDDKIVHDPGVRYVLSDPITGPCQDGYYRIGIIAKAL